MSCVCISYAHAKDRSVAFVDVPSGRVIGHHDTLDNLVVSVCDSSGVFWALQSGPNAGSCGVNNATSLVRIHDGAVVLNGLPSSCEFDSLPYLITRSSNSIVYSVVNLSSGG
jgi:hypothetical protein